MKKTSLIEIILYIKIYITQLKNVKRAWYIIFNIEREEILHP